MAASDPPPHPVLGPGAFRRVQEKWARFAAELDCWRNVSLGTDFARAGGA